MKKIANTFESNRKIAQRLWGHISVMGQTALQDLIERHKLSVVSGDLLLIEGRWYVTHTGLLRLAARKRCVGIRVSPAKEFCDAAAGRWAFKATVYKSAQCKGFVGYGDADPSNVSFMVQG